MENILAQVRERYPYGSKVKSATKKLKHISIVTSKPSYGEFNTKDIYASNTEGFKVLLYCSESGNFAEVITADKVLSESAGKELKTEEFKSGAHETESN